MSLNIGKVNASIKLVANPGTSQKNLMIQLINKKTFPCNQ